MPFTGEAKREYQRKWMAERRTAWFAGKLCVRCGSAEDLQLDHIDPTQKITHRIWSWSAERREKELAKCQVLCGPCHAEKSLEQYEITNGTKLVPHGHYHRYRRGCRCALCTASVARWWREYRSRRVIV